MGISQNQDQAPHTRYHHEGCPCPVCPCGCGHAQRPGGNHGGHDQHGLGGHIHHEVVALITADSALTVDQCSTKCDALFDLVDGHDETQTDTLCKNVCDCEINKNCPHQHGHHPTTKAS